MINYNKLLNNLDELKLQAIKANLLNYIDMVTNKDKSFIDALYELTEKEKSLRNERLMNNSVKTAGFPFLKRINDYDFSFQPSIDKEEIFNDAMITNAILDFLLHHSHILNIVGVSYQTKDILSKLEETD